MSEERLLLGVGRAIITPEVGGNLCGYRPDIYSESVSDDLTAIALYFRQGVEQVLLVSLTITTLNNELSELLRAAVVKETGLPLERVILHATHTHSGPNTDGTVGWGVVDIPYRDHILLPGLISAAKKAMTNPVPIVVGVGVGESDVAVNRRELTARNTLDLGQTPWAPVDRRMTVLSFRDENGQCLANLIHYGCHGTAAGANHEISRDWSGFMCDTLERESGGITAFFNGCIGDTGPRISNGRTTGSKRTERGEEGDITYAVELGQVAARDAVGIWRGIWDWHPVDLKFGTGSISIPLKPKMSAEEAEKLLEKYTGGVNLSGLMRSYLEKTLEAHAAGIPDDTEFVFTQPVVTLGNLALIGFPYEIFSEIGLRIDKMLPEAKALCLSCINGRNGYFVTEDALCRGGYEVRMFLYDRPQPYCENADFALIRQSVDNTRRIIKEQ